MIEINQAIRSFLFPSWTIKDPSIIQKCGRLGNLKSKGESIIYSSNVGRSSHLIIHAPLLSVS
jgi:hypothetical protein